MKTRSGKRPLRTRNAVVIAAAAVFILGSAAYGYSASAEEPESGPATSAVVVGDVQSSVPAEGRIEVERWDLTFATQGVVAAVYIEPGEEVFAGQVLARLSDAKSDAQVDQALAALRGAEARLQGVLAGPSEEDVAVKQASVAAAQSALGTAQEAYRTLVEESEESTVSALELQAKRAAVASAEAALDIAEANLEAARAGATNDDVAEARASVSQARAAADSAAASAGDAVLRAPADGTIVDVRIKPGVSAPAGEGAAVVMADLDSAYVEATLDENDYAKVELGMPVDVLVDALEGTVLEGEVTALSPVGEVDQNGIVTYALRASVETSGTRAAGGMTVRLDVITQRVQDVLTVPTEAVRIERGDQVVDVVVRDGAIRTVKVGLGMTDGSVVEVVSGLSAGDRVVLPQEKAD